MTVFKKNKNYNKVIKFNNNNKKFANKLEKLLKSRKIFKSKKLSKSWNLFKNNIIKRSSFPISNIKIAFNYLKLTFIKALIF